MRRKMYVSTSHVVWIIIKLSWSCLCTILWSTHVEHHIWDWFTCMHSIYWSSLMLLGKCCKGLPLSDTRMSFVTEWRSYCIYMIKSNGSAEGILSCMVFMPDQICMRHSPQTTWFAIFKPEQGSFFSLQDTKIVSEWQFHWDWKPGWNHSGLTCMGTKCHFGIMYM